MQQRMGAQVSTMSNNKKDNNDGGQRSKRQREVPPSVEDVMYFGRFIMENDPFKHRAPREEDCNFRALFGCGPQVCLDLWNKLVAAEVVPKGGSMRHMLWALLYNKTYGKWKTMRRLTQADPKTLRKWIGLFWDAICMIEGDLCWKNRYKGDRSNDCLVSVDTTDCPIPFQGRKFYSQKFKFGSALRYEVAVCILSGDLVWVNGPYEPGMWNDISIFRNSLLLHLDVGERVETDDGYRGCSPEFVKCPASIGGHDETSEAMQSLVRRRHETVNKRFKQFKILKEMYRGDITKHGLAFRVCAIVTQLAIESGEPLFSVDYEDPDFDNHYFEDDEEDDHDDE